MKRLAAALIASLALAFGVVAGGTPAPAQAATCGGVWVVVGAKARCATSFGTGLAALRSAGFEIELIGTGFVCRIGAVPDTCTYGGSGRPFWNYWHAERRADGSYGPWVWSTRGPGVTHPQRGDAEGWSFSASSTAPARPPSTPKPQPQPPATSRGPSAPRTSAPVRSAPSAPAASRPPATSRQQGKPARRTGGTTSAPAATRTSPRDPGPGSPTPVATPTPHVEPTERPASVETTAPEGSVVSAPAESPPVGFVAGLAVLGAGALGLGAWQLAKGRRR